MKVKIISPTFVGGKLIEPGKDKPLIKDFEADIARQLIAAKKAVPVAAKAK